MLASPNYFGCLEDVDAVSALVKASGALLVALVYPSSLGLLRTPGSYGADFAVAEGQCLGNTMSYGGPHLGVFTCKKQYMRQMPGRLCGMLCGYRIKDMSIGRDGGYVVVEGSNAFVALAPYCFPFYAVAAAVIYAGLSWKYDMKKFGFLDRAVGYPNFFM